eukprot:Rmarinus@m.20517
MLVLHGGMGLRWHDGLVWFMGTLSSCCLVARLPPRTVFGFSLAFHLVAYRKRFSPPGMFSLCCCVFKNRLFQPPFTAVPRCTLNRICRKRKLHVWRCCLSCGNGAVLSTASLPCVDFSS